MGAAGHRILPHTADIALEAWAPGKDECIAHAVRALIESFTDLGDPVPTDSIAFTVDPTSPDDLLVAVLDEVIYQIEVHGQIPVDVSIDERTGPAEGRADIRFGTVPADTVELTGALPKAISLHGLFLKQEGGAWRCHVTIDV